MLPPNSFGRDSRADFPSGRFRLVITDAGLKTVTDIVNTKTTMPKPFRPRPHFFSRILEAKMGTAAKQLT